MNTPTQTHSSSHMLDVLVSAVASRAQIFLTELQDSPSKLGWIGVGTGSATMGFSKLAEVSQSWAAYDAVIFRIGAAATALAAVLAVVLQIIKLRREAKRKDD